MFWFWKWKKKKEMKRDISRIINDIIELNVKNSIYRLVLNLPVGSAEQKNILSPEYFKKALYSRYEEMFTQINKDVWYIEYKNYELEQLETIRKQYLSILKQSQTVNEDLKKKIIKIAS